MAETGWEGDGTAGECFRQPEKKAAEFDRHRERRENGFEIRLRRRRLRGISTLADADAKDLRPLVHEQIDLLTDAELEAIRRHLLKMEARRLADELGREFAEDWRTGKISAEKIREAVRGHRARHPYR